jgi:hypothetical protein
MTNAPTPVAPPAEQPPKPANPEPLQQTDDPERRGVHPPAHHEDEHPKTEQPNAKGAKERKGRKVLFD